jgi:hypothetical protein
MCSSSVQLIHGKEEEMFLEIFLIPQCPSVLVCSCVQKLARSTTRDANLVHVHHSQDESD